VAWALSCLKGALLLLLLLLEQDLLLQSAQQGLPCCVWA
jgi:hypothetical protein